MSRAGFLQLKSGEAAPRAQIPEWPAEDFHRRASAALQDGLRIAAYFTDSGPENAFPALLLVLADDAEGKLYAAGSRVGGDSFPSLTPLCPQAHLFEREIFEQTGLRPAGHPWLKPVRFPSLGAPRPETAQAAYYRVEGEEVHEVAVGPVHAGVIEPGHFRFQCHGEAVFHLEIGLGYQHRGVERALAGGEAKKRIHYIETLAGDTSVGHATAHCQAVEALAGCAVPPRAETVRGIALELERLANHAGDLGALAGDVGFLPTASYCGRLRGDFLNMTAFLCGNRFGRGLVCPGGVKLDLTEAMIPELAARLDGAMRDLAGAVELMWASSSAMGRLEETGRISREVCGELGMVGPAARASGVPLDVRRDHPTGVFRRVKVPVSLGQAGDVHARAWVRWLECQRSSDLIRNLLRELPAGPVRSPLGDLAPGAFAVSLVEGWRGEICHCVSADGEGRLSRYKVVDPSFHNWVGLAMALRGQQISDFPLCNKSFNLSYCGHDL
ncbi:MAG: NADH-quinone oxidoreductase subunit C [Candidatus Tectomicrobia bacterium]|uniref:NADH-quinone oxidoreductase subunit C n=1 Tax=Tectimicrobiota bacterium TaxID=2528274 RepID=A0A932HXL1_UNCTE|nr:NADH-quinone oxidoreductase subunit C [Candidatus Tectomicrobia bacterium]